MKVKKTLSVIFAALMVTGLTACDDGSEDGNGVADSNFTVNGNTATVRWDKFDGANGYSIEKATATTRILTS